MRSSGIGQLALFSLAALLLGCQDSVTFAPEIIVGQERITGQVIGGTGPVANATVRVTSAVGSSSYSANQGRDG
jgi:hypothetical protein